MSAYRDAVNTGQIIFKRGPEVTNLVDQNGQPVNSLGDGWWEYSPYQEGVSKFTYTNQQGFIVTISFGGIEFLPDLLIYLVNGTFTIPNDPGFQDPVLEPFNKPFINGKATLTASDVNQDDTTVTYSYSVFDGLVTSPSKTEDRITSFTPTPELNYENGALVKFLNVPAGLKTSVTNNGKELMRVSIPNTFFLSSAVDGRNMLVGKIHATAFVKEFITSMIFFRQPKIPTRQMLMMFIGAVFIPTILTCCPLEHER